MNSDANVGALPTLVVPETDGVPDADGVRMVDGADRRCVGCASVRECHMSVRWRGRKVGGVEMVLLDALAPRRPPRELF